MKPRPRPHDDGYVAVSPLAVHVSTVLDRVDDDPLPGFGDLVDDPVVATPRRVKAGELADERLVEPARVRARRGDDASP